MGTIGKKLMTTFLSKDDRFLSSVEKKYIQLFEDVLHTYSRWLVFCFLLNLFSLDNDITWCNNE